MSRPVPWLCAVALGFDVDGFDDRNRLIDLDCEPRRSLPLNAPSETYAAWVPASMRFLAWLRGERGADVVVPPLHFINLRFGL